MRGHVGEQADGLVRVADLGDVVAQQEELLELFDLVHFLGVDLVDHVAQLGVLDHQLVELLDAFAVEPEELGVQLVFDDRRGDVEPLFEVVELFYDQQLPVADPVFVDLRVVLFVVVEVEVADRVVAV